MEERTPQPAPNRRALVIVADDYGYRSAYDRGILEAAEAGAIDGVSAMALRDGCVAAPLVATGVMIGLHLEETASVNEQVTTFRRRFERDPAYLDGHHHCHASAPFANPVAEAALELGVPVRSVDAEHRGRLRRAGVLTPDRLIGRLEQAEPVVPDEIRRVMGGGELPPGVTEWMVHPGHRDPRSGSAYDAGREEDLVLLLDLARDEQLTAIRTTWDALRRLTLN